MDDIIWDNCPYCNSGSVMGRPEPPYTLKNTNIVVNDWFYKCDDCGEKWFGDPPLKSE